MSTNAGVKFFDAQNLLLPILKILLAWITAAMISVALTGCATLPASRDRPDAFAVTNGAATTLGRLVANAALSYSAVQSGFRLLPEAAFAFDARVALMRTAERSIDMQYYLIRNDDVGLLLLKELRDASLRGVRIRLLVDDLYMGGNEEVFSALTTFPGVEVRLFNPLPSRAKSLPIRLSFSFFDLLRVNHRMHNKLLVADNTLAITGGRNIGNEYFMRNADANFIDVDLLSSGPVVREMSKSFDAFWNSRQVRPIHELVPNSMSDSAAKTRFAELVNLSVTDVALRPRDMFGRSPVGEQLMRGDLQLHWASAHFYADPPDKLDFEHEIAYRGSVSEGALGEISASRHEVKIISPYFVPGPQGMAVLEKFVASGGRAAVVTNSLGSTDEPLAYAGYERYRSDMLKAGISVFEISPQVTARSERFGDFGKSISRLHAKVATMDGAKIFIGSMNLDHRSASINTELGLVIESEALVKELHSFLSVEQADLGYRLQLSPDGRRTQWVARLKEGEEVVYEDVPGTLFWLRLKNWLLLPILGEELL